MPSIPATGQTLPGFDRGDDFAYTWVLTIDANLTDPATWENVRLSVVDKTGVRVTTDLTNQVVVDAGGVSTTVGTDPVTKAISGSGPWTLTLTIPLNQTQTIALTADTLTFQLDFTSAAGKPDTLVRGTVAVDDPAVTLPAE